MSGRIVDLFSGPGGWSEGLRMLGCSEVGIEWDEAACATARAAGHERVQADVAAVDPMDFVREHFAERRAVRTNNFTAVARDSDGKRSKAGSVPYERPVSAPAPTIDGNTGSWQVELGDVPDVDGLIGSPPCQAYSTAGKGAGRRDVAHVLACVAELVAGRDTRTEHAERCEDARSMLVVEPLRWALALRPAWIALEQVPPVLPLWDVFADALRAVGYSVWTGVLEAERFGVPQTRERAILMARRDRPVHPPPPTHQRYVPGEPQRHEVTMLGEVLPWVSMAEALGWGMMERPSVSVASGGEKRRGAKPLGAGSGSQRTIDAERDAGAWAYKLARGEGITERHGDRPAQPATEPAPTISTKARTAEWVMRANKQTNSAVRETGEPAPTITGGHDTGDRAWINGMDRRQGGAPVRAIDELAHTMSSQGLAKGRDAWVHEHPSTTVNGDPRISQPGRHDPDNSGSQQKNTVRVTVQEAAILQSFRPDYPWHGSKSTQYQQVGNAIPPLLARAILSELIDLASQQKAA
jgi:DNA (cytosine-5)-methyltransferase 1